MRIKRKNEFKDPNQDFMKDVEEHYTTSLSSSPPKEKWSSITYQWKKSSKATKIHSIKDLKIEFDKSNDKITKIALDFLRSMQHWSRVSSTQDMCYNTTSTHIFPTLLKIFILRIKSSYLQKKN